MCVRIPATKVSVTVVVENVTLSTGEVTELFNRVPPWMLEDYLPSPILAHEPDEHVTAGHSQEQQAVGFPGHSLCLLWFSFWDRETGVASSQLKPLRSFGN